MTLSQRSECGRTEWKAPGDVFNPHLFEVAGIDTDTEARQFVETHHYSKSYPAAAHRFGLYDWRGQLQGVAVFSVGTNNKTITNVFGGALAPWAEAFELGRFVLRDAVPYNAESWLLARCFELLRREGVKGVVSFSDPYPRRRLDGGVAFLGHWGQIYQATNATYTGRATARTLRLLPSGLVFNDRAQQKIRAGEKGYEPMVQQLVDAGADQLAANEDRAAWLARALERTTRRVRHPGNHRYVFTLDKRVPLQVAECPRPKHTDPSEALQAGLAL